MRAFLLTGHGGLDRHRFVTGWPIPEPGPKEVRVHACGLNTVDVNTRVGRYAREVQAPTQGEGFGVEVGTWSGRVRFPLIQGSDIVGGVDRVGEGADPRLLGRRVVVDNWIRDPEEPWNPMKARYVGSEVDGGFADLHHPEYWDLEFVRHSPLERPRTRSSRDPHRLRPIRVRRRTRRFITLRVNQSTSR